MFTRIIDSPFMRVSSLVAATLVWHLPCLLIGMGVLSLGAGAAAFVMNPWIMGAGIFVSLCASTAAHRAFCKWRCNREGCIPAANFKVTVTQKSWRALRQDAATAKRSARRRNVALGTAFLGASVASATIIPRFTMPHNHCHMLSSIDYTKSVLLSCPNSQESVLVTLSAENQVMFIKGQDVGAMRLNTCGGGMQMWMPHMQPRNGTPTLTMGQAGEAFRRWGCCTIDKQMKAIDASKVDPQLAQSFKDAVRGAWLGSLSEPVNCPHPLAAHAQEMQRQK